MSDSGSTSFDNLIAGTQKALVTEVATIRVYESFSRGALLGRLTATDKWQVIDEDGSSTCNKFGIATEAVDTTAGVEANTDIFVEGEFSENGVIFAYSDTADDWRDKLDAVGIYLRKTISVAGQ
jgi:hypothetical protein